MGELKNIYQSISGVMADIGAIGKNDVNEYDKYKFRGIDAVYNALQPALVKHGVFIVPNLLELTQDDRQTSKGGTQIHSKVKVEYTLYAEDGSFINGIFPGEAMDRSDKSINKAMTAAYKYMLFEIFTIPTEDNKDADSESPEAGAKMDEEKNAQISNTHLKALEKKCEDSGIPYDFICSAYNVDTLADLNIGQYSALLNGWDKVAKSYEKSMEEA